MTTFTSDGKVFDANDGVEATTEYTVVVVMERAKIQSIVVSASGAVPAVGVAYKALGLPRDYPGAVMVFEGDLSPEYASGLFYSR